MTITLDDRGPRSANDGSAPSICDQRRPTSTRSGMTSHATEVSPPMSSELGLDGSGPLSSCDRMEALGLR